MIAIGLIALGAWLAGLGSACIGTALALRRFVFKKAAETRPPALESRDLAPPPGPWQAFAASGRGRGPEARGISVLKPVKGVDAQLEPCLSSFFALTYPRFELLFCVADFADPAIPLIKRLMAKHPRVRSRLSVGALDLGPNPKVCNMARSYASARYDWILISDSNILAEKDYLEGLAADFSEDVGILTSIVAGIEPRSWTGSLEAEFLCSYYARWMLLAESARLPVVIGKSMLLRRSQAERFGGLASLGRYLAEDYMAGKAMAYLGLRVRVASRPVRQPIGALRFREFWSRHLRWGRIRRSQAPIAHALELAVSAIPSGLLGALAAQCLFGGGGGVVFAAHCLLWIGCDAAQTRALGGRFRWLEAAAWVARESLAAPLWLHVILGRTVMWRGHELRLGRGGLLLEEAPADTLLWAAPREEGRA